MYFFNGYIKMYITYTICTFEKVLNLLYSENA